MKMNTRKQYTHLEKHGRLYLPYLVVDHQAFQIIDKPTTKKSAEWFRDQLVTALDRLIQQNQNNEITENNV
jgi:hypothetical protein